MAVFPRGPDEQLERCGSLSSMKALSAHGVTRRQSRRRVAAGRWVELMPGVVAPAGIEIDDVVRLSAAIAYVDHPAAVLAREAGLWGHRLSAAAGGPDRCPETIDVDVPYGVRRRSAGFVRVHQRPPRVPVWWGDLPVIDVQDLVIDAAGWLDPVDLRGLVIGAVGERGVDARALAAAARSWRGRGVGVLREAVEEVRLGARSPVEGLAYRGVIGAGLPAPELNGRVATRDGPRYVDLLWRALRLGVEIDGRRWHHDAGQWQADLARMNALLAEGIVLLRFPAARVLADLPGVVAEVAEALVRRARELGIDVVPVPGHRI